MKKRTFLSVFYNLSLLTLLLWIGGMSAFVLCGAAFFSSCYYAADAVSRAGPVKDSPPPAGALLKDLKVMYDGESGNLITNFAPANLGPYALYSLENYEQFILTFTTNGNNTVYVKKDGRPINAESDGSFLLPAVQEGENPYTVTIMPTERLSNAGYSGFTYTLNINPPEENPIVRLRDIKVTFMNETENQIQDFEAQKTGPYMVKSDETHTQFELTVSKRKNTDIVTVTREGIVILASPAGAYSLPVLTADQSNYFVIVTITRPNPQAPTGTPLSSCAYTIAVNPPGRQNVPLTEIRDVIAEAEEKITELSIQSTVVVGNPALNSSKSTEIAQTMSDLNTLKQGILIERQFLKDNGDGTNSQATETVIYYDIDAINVKIMQLTALIDSLTNADTYIRVKEKFFTATNSMETVLLDPENAGTYEIEAVGGSGGHVWTTGGATQTGGRGGYVKARFAFAAGTQLAVRVGSAGEGSALFDETTGIYKKIASGYNTVKAGGKSGELPSGGKGGAALSTQPNYAAGGGGGGATEIRYFADKDAIPTLVQSNDVRLVVAAGGGGSAQCSSNPWPAVEGGAAGCPGLAAKGNSRFPNYSPQSAESSSERGQDGAEGLALYEGRGGGGGGFRGGGAITTGFNYKNSNDNLTGSGAGGVNYVKYPPAHNPTLGVATSTGDGWLKITWVQ
ncbi:MAG: hypothetical protein LBG74_01935 [Spirochaetaceae bacterium]|jgi:hypothetical protein|nr:hypothetical protein [Spirochaetaceae bacterium]